MAEGAALKMPVRLGPPKRLGHDSVCSSNLPLWLCYPFS